MQVKNLFPNNERKILQKDTICIFYTKNEEILNGKLHFLSSAYSAISRKCILYLQDRSEIISCENKWATY